MLAYVRSRNYRSVVVRVALGALVFCLFLLVTRRPLPWETEPWYHRSALCQRSERFRAELKRLLFAMHAALQSVNVSHALCYGTLWGALRQGEILPWDKDVDLCALDSGGLGNVTEAQLRQAFARQRLALLDFDWRRSKYTVRPSFPSRGEEPSVKLPAGKASAVSSGKVLEEPSVKSPAGKASAVSSGDGEEGVEGVEGSLHVFTELWGLSDSLQGRAGPRGWAPAVWRAVGLSQVEVPVWLLEPPLDRVRVHGTPLPVPHDGIELLKYLYPADWWTVAKPKGC